MFQECGLNLDWLLLRVAATVINEYLYAQLQQLWWPSSQALMCNMFPTALNLLVGGCFMAITHGPIPWPSYQASVHGLLFRPLFMAILSGLSVCEAIQESMWLFCQASMPGHPFRPLCQVVSALLHFILQQHIRVQHVSSTNSARLRNEYIWGLHDPLLYLACVIDTWT